jgi:hypothetical protein
MVTLDLHLRDAEGKERLNPPISLRGRPSPMVMALPETGDWSLEINTTGQYAGQRKVLGAVVHATVVWPAPFPDGTGVTITRSGTAERARFVKAMVTPGAVVRVLSGVNLDLTGVATIPVAPGVQLIGDRSVYPNGPRLFTTTFAPTMFQIGFEYPALQVDHVRITGIRLDGGQSDTATAYAGLEFDEDAINILSSQDIEIDHNEIYRWHGAAVHVTDPRNVINVDNASVVRVHDNFIHDNQHPTASGLESSGHGAGYGVELSAGAYALIEHNVFNNDRHAITGDGNVGTGYYAYGNLFLHPGIDRTIAGVTHYNHQIDMHGRKTCGHGESLNCGPGGEYMDVAFNTVTSTDSDAIQLRGVPARKMRVGDNVFAQSYQDALTQTVGGLEDQGTNTFNDTRFFDASRWCDFDGDGVTDSFRATGATWWYLSSRLGYFVYLNTSKIVNPSITLGDRDGDNRCDMFAGGRAFLNPDPTMYARPQAEVTTVNGAYVAFNLFVSGGAPAYTWTVRGLPPGVTASPAGLVVGRPAGTQQAYAVTATVRDRNGQSRTITFRWSVTVSTPNVLGSDQYTAQNVITAAGLTVGTVTTVNDCVSRGDVEVQHPAAGAAVVFGSPVDITVSGCTTPPPGGGGGGGAGPGPILPK